MLTYLYPRIVSKHFEAASLIICKSFKSPSYKFDLVSKALSCNSSKIDKSTVILSPVSAGANFENVSSTYNYHGLEVLCYYKGTGDLTAQQIDAWT